MRAVDLGGDGGDVGGVGEAEVVDVQGGGVGGEEERAGREGVDECWRVGLVAG